MVAFFLKSVTSVNLILDNKDAHFRNSTCSGLRALNVFAIYQNPNETIKFFKDENISRNNFFLFYRKLNFSKEVRPNRKKYMEVIRREITLIKKESLDILFRKKWGGFCETLVQLIISTKKYILCNEARRSDMMHVGGFSERNTHKT